MEEISIKLPVNAWNVVMQALAKRPFEEVSDLLAEIKKQGDAAVAANTAGAEDAEQAAA